MKVKQLKKLLNNISDNEMEIFLEFNAVEEKLEFEDMAIIDNKKFVISADSCCR